MKMINSRLHGYLDYAVVVGFLLAPSLLGLSGLPAMIAYTLAIVHLLVTLLSAFSAGIVKIIPMKIHSAIEFIVSFALIALPWLLNFSVVPVARNFYIIAGLLIFLVWLTTDYQVSGTKTVTTKH